MASSARPRRLWIFNSTMVWGAALGWLIVTAVGYLQDTINHHGSGIVTYGDGDRVDFFQERVSEEKYKRHHYTYGSVGLGLGILFWFFIARGERDADARAVAEKEYLKARLEERIAYVDAFAAAVDDNTREHARARALASGEYLAAAKALEATRGAHWNAVMEMRELG